MVQGMQRIIYRFSRTPTAPQLAPQLAIGPNTVALFAYAGVSILLPSHLLLQCGDALFKSCGHNKNPKCIDNNVVR